MKLSVTAIALLGFLGPAMANHQLPALPKDPPILPLRSVEPGAGKTGTAEDLVPYLLGPGPVIPEATDLPPAVTEEEDDDSRVIEDWEKPIEDWERPIGWVESPGHDDDKPAEHEEPVEKDDKPSVCSPLGPKGRKFRCHEKPPTPPKSLDPFYAAKYIEYVKFFQKMLIEAKAIELALPRKSAKYTEYVNSPEFIEYMQSLEKERTKPAKPAELSAADRARLKAKLADIFKAAAVARLRGKLAAKDRSKDEKTDDKHNHPSWLCLEKGPGCPRPSTWDKFFKAAQLICDSRPECVDELPEILATAYSKKGGPLTRKTDEKPAELPAKTTDSKTSPVDEFHIPATTEYTFIGNEIITPEVPYPHNRIKKMSMDTYLGNETLRNNFKPCTMKWSPPTRSPEAPHDMAGRKAECIEYTIEPSANTTSANTKALYRRGIYRWPQPPRHKRNTKRDLDNTPYPDPGWINRWFAGEGDNTKADDNALHRRDVANTDGNPVLKDGFIREWVGDTFSGNIVKAALAPLAVKDKAPPRSVTRPLKEGWVRFPGEKEGDEPIHMPFRTEEEKATLKSCLATVEKEAEAKAAEKTD